MTTNVDQVQRLGMAKNPVHIRRGLVFGLIIVSALLAFEIFNYSTTDFALNDLLGELNFFGISWATILAIAFCGIDFAGIARLFTPEKGEGEPNEVWYLFGAWLLAATMNAMLTWWGVSIAILSHQTLGNTVVERDTLLRIVPIFVAILVWLIRVLIIGTFSVAGERLFSQDERSRSTRRSYSNSGGSQRSARTLGKPTIQPRPTPIPESAFRPAPKSSGNQSDTGNRPEPTYAPLHMSPPNMNRVPEPKASGPFSSKISIDG